VHLLIILSSAGLVLASGWVALRCMPRIRGWRPRRELQLLVLAAPVLSLALAIGGLHHFAGQTCFIGAPPWDYTLSVGLPLAMSFVALGACLLGIIRLLLMQRLMGARGVPAGPELQATVGELAHRLGARGPRILVCADDRPVALTYGLVRPTLLLSRWMLGRLDGRELESVLAHEMAHVARRDYLVVWLATVLRDALCYLPTSWIAHRQLQAEKEYACDDLAVGVTGRPLALASALATVWQPGPASRSLSGVPALAGSSGAVEARIARLLVHRVQPTEGRSSGLLPLGTGTAAVVGLVAAETMNVATLLAPLGCSHAMVLGKFF